MVGLGLSGKFKEVVFFAQEGLIALALCMVTTVCVTHLWAGRPSLLPAHHPYAWQSIPPQKKDPLVLLTQQEAMGEAGEHSGAIW